MRECTYLEAIQETLDEALSQDATVFLMGEDIGIYGGGFGATTGLQGKYGGRRVRDTPISESALAGFAVGAAMTGMRPIIELQFSDFITTAMDQLVNQAAKIHYMYNGQMNVPLVMRTAGGTGTGAGAQHSQSLENWLTHIPGLKVIQPSTAYDVKGMLHAAIEDNNPVMVYEHKLLYATSCHVPNSRYVLPLSKADVKRKGSDVTIIATGIMVQKSLRAAELAELQGISVEVVDPRTLVPLDKETILHSVKKTKRVIIVTEAVKTSGFGAELAACIAESTCSMELVKPIIRLGGEFVPIPVQRQLESAAIPQVETIANAIKDVLKTGESL